MKKVMTGVFAAVISFLLLGLSVSAETSNRAVHPWDIQDETFTISHPLKEGTYRLTQGFGYMKHPFGMNRLHRGIDLAARPGTPIHAVEDGYVLRVGKAKGYGNWIVLMHPNGLLSVYGHMHDEQLHVELGQQIKRGDHIADVGNSGASTGPHLHFELHKFTNSFDFIPVDPKKYFEE